MNTIQVAPYDGMRIPVVAFLATLIVMGCWKKPDRSSPSKEDQNSSSEAQQQSEMPPNQDIGSGRDTGSPDLSTENRKALSAEEIYQKVQSSLVLVMVQGREGRRLGSGFFSGPGTIITNEHVVEEASEIQVKLAAAHDKRSSEARTAAVHPIADLAVLQSSKEVRGLPLGRLESVTVGESVFVVSNPRGLEATFSKGIVSGIRSRDGATVLQITAPVSEGSSGGPVLNEAGEVIGVVFAVRPDGQNLNFAVPVSYVRETLQDAR